ncbi:MAG: TonB family protein [Kiritimatiellaeota bacterium]|nr:TonB family protein [Kiritimatiellota bacterium]
MLWARPASGAAQLSLDVARPAWRCFGLSVLLHGALIAAVIAWTPKVIKVVRTYEVELVTVRPVVKLTAKPPVPMVQKTEPPPKPPEPKKEISPPKPKPAPVLVATVAKPAPVPVAYIPASASVVQSPLRIAVASALAPTPATIESTTNVASAVAAGNGTEEVSDPAYLNTVRNAVARHLRYPELALRRGVEGRVVLRLTLDATGRLLASGAGEAQGDRALLGAALAAVKRAAPFPPWQGAHNTGATLNLTLPIRFRLDER